VGIENAEHAGDSAVVDGLIGFLANEGVGVVLLDDGVDVGEVVEAIAEGGFVRGRLGAEARAEQSAEEGAEPKKKDHGGE
jgi:hypothetical protein